MSHQLERYFKKSLARYSDMPDWDDAVQEACIQAWKDEGKFDENQIKARAVIRGKQILLHQTGVAGGSHMMGHVGRKSREGVVSARGEASREKIRQYMEEYVSLHDKEPSNREISQAVGIDAGTVADHRKRMRSFGVSVDIKDVKVHSLYAGVQVDDDDDVAFAIRRTAVQWEADLIDKLTVESLMSVLTKKQYDVVFCTHWLGLSSRKAGEYLGISQPTVRLHLKAAYERMRKGLESV